MSPTTPEAVIGLELEGRGFDSANRELDKHAMGWEKVEGHVGRIGGAVDSIASRVGQLAGAVGLGALISDFVRLDDVASRAALSVNRATGRGGFAPIKGAAQAAAIATSTDSRELLGTMAALQGRVGGSYLDATANWGVLGRSLGDFSRAYGIELPTLGAQVGAMELYQGIGVGGTQGLLAQVASQAARSGQAGQTAQFMQAVATATSMLGQSHPGFTGPGTSRTLGALYGAVSGVNSAFKDPALFAAGVAGIDSGLTQAYSNPRLQAALQMAGVGYWEQRGGLGGKHGKDMAGKLLRWSDQQYGHGTVEQDLFLRSQFGDVSADMLRAFSKGEVTYDQLLKKADPRATRNEIERRSRSDQESAGAQLQKKREQAGKDVGGAGNFLFDALNHLSFNDLLALGVGYKGGKILLGKGAKRLFKGLRAKGAASALEADSSVAARVLRATGATEAEIAAALGGGAEGGALARALGVGAKGLRFAGPLGAAVGFGLDADNAGDPNEVARLHAHMTANQHFAATHAMYQARRKFGAHWQDNPDAMKWLHARLGRPFGRRGEHTLMGTDDVAKVFGAIGHATSGAAAGAGGGQVVDKFADAVNRFDRILRRMERDQGPHRDNSSWTGGNASGLQSVNDVVGGNMVMASLIAGGGAGGAGGGGMSPASWISDPRSAGPGGGGSHPASGAAGRPCTLTYYAPSRGGINGHSGGGAAGVPLYDSSWGCAAPSAYAFGTIIRFTYKGRSVDVPVLDRGGAINGDHFDLLPGPAKALGMYSAGKVRARFKVVGHKKVGKPGADGQRPGAGAQSNPNAVAASSRSAAGSGAGLQEAIAWMGAGGGGAGGGGDRQPIHVHIDGREIHRQRRLTRGNA